MAQYTAGLQVALELTNIIPIKDLAISGAMKLLEYARELRKIGSDVVIETDLAMIFGQLLVSSDLEKEFRVAVRGSSRIHLNERSLLVLSNETGPTILNSMGSQAVMATAIQLSMLLYFCDRRDLANILSQAMGERHKAGIKHAQPGPVVFELSNTLQTFGSQCAGFPWHVYKSQALKHLQTSIPAYAFTADHLLKVSSSGILAFMDMLHIAQRFPEERSITVGNDTGCLLLIIWAHYIAGLTVAVMTKTNQEARFGGAIKPHIVILSPIDGKIGYASNRHLLSTYEAEDPIIRLHEKDVSLILECKPSTKLQLTGRICDRHPLALYGSAFLKRAFNTQFITPENDPIYVEAALMVIAFAICVTGTLPSNDSAIPLDSQTAAAGQRLRVENWRILKAANLLFQHLVFAEIEVQRINSFIKFLLENRPKPLFLPNNFDSFIDLHCLRNNYTGLYESFLRPIQTLGCILAFLSRISDINDCVAIPLLFNPWSNGGELPGRSAIPSLYLYFLPPDVANPSMDCSFSTFHGIASLFSSSFMHHFNADQGPSNGNNSDQLVCAYSDCGWTLFLDTLSNKDPADTVPNLIHLKRGIPTKESTREQRCIVKDGIQCGTKLSSYFEADPQDYQPERFIPLCSAKVLDQWDDCVTTATSFELRTHAKVEQSLEWRSTFNKRKTAEISWGYRRIHDALWGIQSVPTCIHADYFHKELPYPKDTCVHLGDNAVAVGWNCQLVREKHPETKVMVYLARGSKEIRWFSISLQPDYKSAAANEEVACLVPANCCEECALQYALDFKARKVALIL